MQEIRIRLQPKQKLFRETVDKTRVTFYGGAKGGGKSKGMRDILLARRFQYPGTHAGLFRRTYKELEGNHISKLFKEYPALRPFWNDGKKLLTLPNKSTLEFCHCEHEKDVELYQGREFEDLGIEEAGQWTESMFRTLHGSNRSSTPGFKARTLLTGNPGGIGHGWLKRLFIQRRFNEREDPNDYAFVQAFVRDNPALIENDPDYIKNLEAEPNEALRKAYLYGDWEIFAGQFFNEISYQIHVIKPFEIPRHWNRFGAYDYGFNHPAAFGWFANDGDGNTYMYREFIQAGLRVDQFAKELNNFDDTKLLNPIPAGLDCWTQKQVLREDKQEPPTVAEEFLRNHGINLERAVVDRAQGAAQLRRYLAWQKNSKDEQGNIIDGKPRLFFFNTCPTTFETISRMVHDPKKPEDVLKVNATEGDPLSGDDAYDMVRYGLMSRPHISTNPKVYHKPGTPEWNKEQEEMHVKAALEQMKRDKNLRENKSDYGSWQKNKNGIPSWNVW